MTEIDTLRHELAKENIKEQELMKEIKSCEDIIAGRRKTEATIKSLQDRLNVAQINSSNLKARLSKLKEQIKQADDAIGKDSVEELNKKLTKEFQKADKLKKEIDDADAEFREKSSNLSEINRLKERIARQKAENKKLADKRDKILSLTPKE